MKEKESAKDTTKIPKDHANKDFYKGFNNTQLHKYLREMWLIRVLEEKIGFDYRLKKIGGFCHLYVGQEAVCVGSIATLDLSRDYVLTSYRDHGHAISCGINPDKIIAELYGKVTGCSRGKGGSMHLFNVEKGFLGGNGIVGAQIPIATGAAFSQKYRENQGVTLCYFGDGAINQGAFHESINLAKLWNLPCIYVIENNRYGMGTAVARASSIDFSGAGESYGVSGVRVNGMDFFDVYKAFDKVVKHTREHRAPYVIEVQTYRYYGHSMSDPATYRSKEELAFYKNHDPVEQMKKELLLHGFLTKAEAISMQESIIQQVAVAQQFAADSPDPPLESIYQDILAE